MHFVFVCSSLTVSRRITFLGGDQIQSVTLWRKCIENYSHMRSSRIGEDDGGDLM